MAPVSSSNSVRSNRVMRSSDGCVDAPVDVLVERASSRPCRSASVPIGRCMVSTKWSRSMGWSPSGMPSSSPITRIGTSRAKSPIMSNCSRPASVSRVLAQNSRTSSSIWLTARGVNTRESRARWKVWNGGSSKMNSPGATGIFAEHGVEDRALAGDERVAVLEHALDVVVPADRVEAVAIVVVQGRVVAELPVQRERVLVDLPVPRIPVDVGRGRAHPRRSPLVRLSTLAGVPNCPVTRCG